MEGAVRTWAAPVVGPRHRLTGIWLSSHRHRVVSFGHRGYPVIAPENTLPSFRLALTAGADLVELDYHHSSDGVPVVLHDTDLDRTTDAPERWQARKVRVETRTAHDLQTLDAGRWSAPGYAGTRLPLLTEASGSTPGQTGEQWRHT
ncbi:MAG: hypothetical protein FJ387_29665 [Verrucomicrobia bacterium]|nr:hypothetical protein [Verrucomicrobiota bacterium]